MMTLREELKGERGAWEVLLDSVVFLRLRLCFVRQLAVRITYSLLFPM